MTTLSQAELAQAAGISPRQLRRWIEWGAIDRACGRGKARYYTVRHLEQVRTIAHLRRQFRTIRQVALSRG
jgi:DNA-binding transcriptional MerR regulator